MKSKDNLLFIGAGASKGAREFDSHTPPLGNELLDYLQTNLWNISKQLMNTQHISCVAACDAALNIIKKNNTETNFEKFLSNLTRIDRQRINKAIQICFTDLSEAIKDHDIGFSTHRDGYDDLIKKLSIQSSDWNIISLNYDLLFECALIRSGIDFEYYNFRKSYEHKSPSPDSLFVFKPHGSINFFAHADHNFSVGGIPEIGNTTRYSENSNGDVVPDYPHYYAAGLSIKEMLYRVCDNTIYPAIANYTRGKGIDNNPSALAKVRENATAAFKNAKHIVIAGVRPIDDESDDTFVSDLFKSRRKNITYIGYGEYEAAKVRSLFDDVIIFQNGLMDYLSK